MKTRIWLFSFVLTGLLASFSAVQALDLAVPGDMFPYTVEVSGDVGVGQYYYIDPFALNHNMPLLRGYLMIIDSDGNLVWFKNAGEEHYSNLQAYETFGWYSHSLGSGDEDNPVPTVILDSGFEEIDRFGKIHPNGNFEHDPHEFMLMDDRSTWTLWRSKTHMDMSEVIPGGHPNALVYGHVIQRWDADKNVQWSWNSLDHMEALPITARLDSSQLLRREFEHLHINAFDFFPDGDILASSRQLSILFRIDSISGDVLWKMGGGPANEFSFEGDQQIPLDFNFQHDCRLLDNGNITVFDNGFYHDPPRSYAREYEVDEVNHVATLVDYHVAQPPTAAFVTGSFRHLDDGHELVCWGNMYPEKHATEYDENGNVIWELTFETDPISQVRPGGYRIEKTTQFTPAARPYVTHFLDEDQLELTCNWFGHEDEVAQYLVYGGNSPASSDYLGSTDDGYFMVSDPDPGLPWYYRIRAADALGVPISDYSEWTKLNSQVPGVVLTPLVTDVPAGGGEISFSLELTSTFDLEIPGVHAWTEVMLPDETVIGPLVDVRFTAEPYMVVNIDEITQPVPANAPSGEYVFTVGVGWPDSQYMATDSFTFTKQDTGVADLSASSSLEQSWLETMGFSEYFENSRVVSETLPERFTLEEFVPNPFNSSTATKLSLPYSAMLRVAVFDVLGREVLLLADEEFASGQHRLTFDASMLASGIYFVRATVPGRLYETRKVVLLK